MATLERRNDHFRIIFFYKNKRYAQSLHTGDIKEAETLRGGIEERLMRLNQNLVELRPGADLVDYVVSGINIAEGERPAAQGPPPDKITFAKLRDAYLETHAHGAMEENSLSTVRLHLGHFAVSLGERFPMPDLKQDDLQAHVTKRSQKKYRGKKLSPVTLRKEMASFRAVWNWGVDSGKLTGQFPNRGLKYPKYDEKLPFMTWHEIERKIAPDMTQAEKAELWDCLYLRADELAQLLAFVKDHAAHPWIYPLFCFAAHTGTRRSEILRVLVSDVDFDASVVLVREKKRSRKQRTTRRVPLTPFLIGVLKEWIAAHPGGRHLFCHHGEVARSKKRSKTTGHRNDKERPSSHNGRMATVRKREKTAVGSLTRDEIHDHFKRTLAGSKWAVLRGMHALRHSFISACASKGVDQRLLDEWTGHSTEEQRRRYRHLYPTTQQEAIKGVFE
jgi:integrase